MALATSGTGTATAAHCAGTAPRRSWPRFALHYLEMVAAMLVGMVVLGLVQSGVIAATDADALRAALDGPLVMTLLMTAYMVAGMGAWMAFRGHSRRSNVEMNAAMVAPVPLLLALQAAGALGEAAAMLWLHVLMLASMLAYMLLRSEHCG